MFVSADEDPNEVLEQDQPMPPKAFKVEVFESRTQRYNRTNYKALNQGKSVFTLFHKDDFDFSA